MSYVSPAANAILFDWQGQTAYTPPLNDTADLEFPDATTGASGQGASYTSPSANSILFDWQGQSAYTSPPNDAANLEFPAVATQGVFYSSPSANSILFDWQGQSAYTSPLNDAADLEFPPVGTISITYPAGSILPGAFGVPAFVNLTQAESIPTQAVLGAPRFGWTYPAAPVNTTVVPLAYVAFEQIARTSGSTSTVFGTSYGSQIAPITQHVVGSARSLRPVAFGSASTATTVTSAAEGLVVGGAGQPTLRLTQTVLGWTEAVVGTPGVATGVGAMGFRPTTFGLGIALNAHLQRLPSTGARFGTPRLRQPNVRRAYAIPARTWFGIPRSNQGEATQAQGWVHTVLGEPLLQQAYRAFPKALVVRMGTPSARRTT